MLDEYPRSQWWQFASPNEKLMAEIEALRKQYDESKKRLEQRFVDKVEKLQRGDELPPGVMKMVKVFVAVKRKLQPGDKMAGRHGNKGVISQDRADRGHAVPRGRHAGRHRAQSAGRAEPHERRPDPRDPSRLGLRRPRPARSARRVRRLSLASRTSKPLKDTLKKVYGDDETIAALNDDALVELGEQPEARRADRDAGVRRRARKPTSNDMLEQAGLDNVGPGDAVSTAAPASTFDRKVTVGYIYMLKLHHLVDDKIHARSIGPYSLVTQQPLGGKAQFGGQRFGEMEVWALEAYGAAYTLQEMLTVKSDDVAGRTKVYEAIVRGDDTFEAGIPESFNVLVKEMRSLGLNVELINTKPEAGCVRRRRAGRGRVS